MRHRWARGASGLIVPAWMHGQRVDGFLPTSLRAASGARGGGGSAYATWSPTDKSANISLSGGNLIATADTTAWKAIRATMGKSAGKWYWEITVTTGGTYFMVDVCTSAASVNDYVAHGLFGWAYYNTDGKKWTGGTGSAYGATFTGGDVISVALDMDNGKVWWAKNGTWQASGAPAAGTGAAFTGLSGTIYPSLSPYNSGIQLTANFGASAFSYSVPSGFNAGVY